MILPFAHVALWTPLEGFEALEVTAQPGQQPGGVQSSKNWLQAAGSAEQNWRHHQESEGQIKLLTMLIILW